MKYETIDGTFRQTNLKNEPADYLAQREQLRLAEIELMKQQERVSNSSKARERWMRATRRFKR